MLIRAFRNRWPHTVVNERRCVVHVRLYIRRALVITFNIAPGQFMSLPPSIFALEGAEIVPAAVIR